MSNKLNSSYVAKPVLYVKGNSLLSATFFHFSWLVLCYSGYGIFFCHPKVARYPLTCACIALKALVAWSKENQGEARTSHLWSLHSASLQKSCETESWLHGLYDLSPSHLCTPISDLFAICSALFINPNLCKMKPAKAFCFPAVRVHKDRQ